MDTENFILTRTRLTEQLQRRRTGIHNHPLGLLETFGIKLPGWARIALSFFNRDGVVTRFLELGLPLAVPFLFKKQTPFLGRLVQRIFSPKS